MKSKNVRRLSAMLMASAVMAATLGMNVCAADSITSVPVTKTIAAGEKVPVPYTDFRFEVKAGSSSTITNDDGTTTVVYAGLTDANGAAKGVAFASGADTIDFKGAAAMEGSTNLSLDVTAFTTPGVYRYVVSEAAGTYDGMSYDSKTYTLDVYVEQGNGENTIAAVTLDGSALGTGDGKAAGAAFTNTYTTQTLKVTKDIEGNQADMTKEFKFDIEINGVAGESYTLVNGNTIDTLTCGENGKVSTSVYLGESESVEIYGLSANDTYTVTEEDTSSDGYKTEITGAQATNGLVASGNGSAAADITYTNTKNVTTPTGIIMTIAPFALMVVLAGVVAVVFLRRRNRAEF